MTIGEKIYELRKKLGISQEELAQQLNVSRQAVSKWERDETMPDTDKIVALSSVFSISTDYLLLENSETEKSENNLLVTIPPKKRWKLVLGIILCASGLLLGLFGGLGLFVWRYLLKTSSTAPTSDMQPFINIMNLLLWGSIFVALISLVAGIILLKFHRKEE